MRTCLHVVGHIGDGEGEQVHSRSIVSTLQSSLAFPTLRPQPIGKA